MLWSLSRQHLRHADAHRRAAQVLRDSEDPRACDHVGDREVTSSCPLATYEVGDYAETSEGVEVVYVGAEAALLQSHVRCHLAHARMVSDEHPDAEQCPLLGTGTVITVEEHPDGALLLLRTDDPAEGERLHGLYDQGASGHGHR